MFIENEQGCSKQTYLSFLMSLMLPDASMAAQAAVPGFSTNAAWNHAAGFMPLSAIVGPLVLNQAMMMIHDGFKAKIFSMFQYAERLFLQYYKIFILSAIVLWVILHGVPILLSAIGFTLDGIAANSLAAAIQSIIYGGSTCGIFSIFQSVGATGSVGLVPAAVGVLLLIITIGIYQYYY